MHIPGEALVCAAQNAVSQISHAHVSKKKSQEEGKKKIQRQLTSFFSKRKNKFTIDLVVDF
jgi:hypothetical protein